MVAPEGILCAANFRLQFVPLQVGRYVNSNQFAGLSMVEKVGSQLETLRDQGFQLSGGPGGYYPAGASGK